MDESTNQKTVAAGGRGARSWRIVRIALLVVAALLTAIVMYLQSNGFKRSLHQRIVAEVEQRLNARVSIQEFDFSWLSLTAHIGGLVIDSTNPNNPQAADAKPFLSVRSIDASWRLLSLFPLRADFASLQLAGPEIHAEFYPEGGSNIPTLRASGDSGRLWTEDLIALRMGRFEVLDGELEWDERRIPLALQAEKFELRMKHVPPAALPESPASSPESYSGSMTFQAARLELRHASPIELRGAMRFTLQPRQVELTQVSLASGSSRIEGAATVKDLRTLDLAVHYDARLNWADLNRWMNLSGWQGDVRLRGEGAITSAATQLNGQLSMNTIHTGARNWEHIPWKLEAGLSVRRERGPGPEPVASAKLSNMRVAALGGTLAGQADIQFAGGTTRVASKLALSRAQFAEVADALRVLPVNLRQLPWATEFSGPVEVAYLREPGSANTVPDLRLDADLTAQPPESLPPGLTPVSGAMRARFVARDRRLEDVVATFELPGAKLHAAGWMQEAESDMQLKLEASRIESIQPPAELFWREFGQLPIRLDGRIQARSRWTGGWREANFRGPVTMSGISYEQNRWDEASGTVTLHRRSLGTPPAKGETDERHTRTELEISTGILRQGKSTSEFTLALDLHDGKFAPDSRFQAAGRLRQFDVAVAQALFGASIPLQGNVNGEFRAAGTRQNPRGSASMSMTGGTVRGEAFTALSAEIQFEQDVVRLEPLRLTRDGVVSGRVTIWPARKQFELDLMAEKFSLEKFPTLRDQKYPVKGLLSGHIMGKGTFDVPALNGEFTLQDAGFGDVRDGQLRGTVQTQGNDLQWSATGALFGGDVATNGQVGMAAPYALAASVELRNGAVRNLGAFAHGLPEGLDGSIDVSGRVRGNAADPRTLVADGEIRRVEISRMGVSVRNQQPVPIHFEGQQLRVDSLRLVGEQIDLSASGTIRTSSDPAMNLRAVGSINLAMLSKLDPQVATQGRAELDAQISGTFRLPQWRGRLVVRDASAQFGRLANSLSAIRGTVVFDGNRGDLEDFHAESGGGEIQIGGAVRYGEGSGLQFNLNGRLRNVRIRYPEALSTWVDGQVNWNGSTRASLLEGRVTITRHSIAPPNDLAQVLFSRRRGASQPLNSPFLRNLRLNLAVASAPEVRLDTRTARNLQTAVDARIQGTGEQPSILGRIGVLSGEIEFAGKRYTINRGEVSFLNPFRFEPELNLNVQARVQQYDITMDFSGPPDRLNVTYRSDPPLPTRDILALLVAGGGRPTGLQPSAQPLPQVTADSLLSQALSSQIGSRLDRIFGAGRLRVDPQLNTASGKTSATVALEQQIRNNITLLYATDVSSAQQQYVQGEWIISPKLSVVGIRDQNGLVGVNFQITLRFE